MSIGNNNIAVLFENIKYETNKAMTVYEHYNLTSRNMIKNHKFKRVSITQKSAQTTVIKKKLTHIPKQTSLPGFD